MKARRKDWNIVSSRNAILYFSHLSYKFCGTSVLALILRHNRMKKSMALYSSIESSSRSKFALISKNIWCMALRLISWHNAWTYSCCQLERLDFWGFTGSTKVTSPHLNTKRMGLFGKGMVQYLDMAGFHPHSRWGQKRLWVFVGGTFNFSLLDGLNY